MQKVSGNEEGVKAFLAKYEDYVSKHGELFEVLEVPYDEADKQVIRNSYLAPRVPLSFMVLVSFVTLYFNFPTTIGQILLFVVTWSGIIAGFVWSFRGCRKLISKGIKTVTNGIITGKRTYGKGDDQRRWIELSRKIEFRIGPGGFKKFSYGDMVKIEQLDTAKLAWVQPKFILVGKAPIGYQEPTNVAAEESQSLWARAGRFVRNSLFGNS